MGSEMCIRDSPSHLAGVPPAGTTIRRAQRAVFAISYDISLRLRAILLDFRLKKMRKWHVIATFLIFILVIRGVLKFLPIIGNNVMHEVMVTSNNIGRGDECGRVCVVWGA